MSHDYKRRRKFLTVQEWMDATGVNQRDLAKVLNISDSHLCNILRKNRNCSGALALRISQITNVPLEALIDTARSSQDGAPDQEQASETGR